MCRIIASFLIAFASVSAANAQVVIDTIPIPVDNSLAISSVSLNSGETYLIRAVGTINFVPRPSSFGIVSIWGSVGILDADYALYPEMEGNVPQSIGGAGRDFGLTVNGIKPDWGPFQADHIYTIPFVGDGSSIEVGYPQLGNFIVDPVSNFSVEIIQLPADLILGDVNNDGLANFFDIAPFIAILSSGEFQAQADIDQNGLVNFLDVAPFIAVLSLL